MDTQLSFTTNANSFAVLPCKVVTGGVGQEDDTCAFVLLQIRDTIVPPGLQRDLISSGHLSKLSESNIEVKSINMSHVCVNVHETLH